MQDILDLTKDNSRIEQDLSKLTDVYLPNGQER